MATVATFIDLAGQKFGKWTVIKRSSNGNTGKVRWLCKCECGEEYSVLSKGLRSGKSTQCKPCSRLKRVAPLKGKKFGKLTVLARAKSSNGGKTRWQCQCECGNKPIVHACNLISGHSAQCLSCRTSERNTTHGLASHPLYRIWAGMKSRCYNKKSDRYHRYGGRGITVCSKWLNSFQSFYDDMIDGYVDGLQIDRRNNDGNYEPGNCRWLTGVDNIRNSSLAKLNLDQVMMIRIKRNYGITVKSLSTAYGMSRTQIKDIVSGKSWKNIVNENFLSGAR